MVRDKTATLRRLARGFQNAASGGEMSASAISYIWWLYAGANSSIEEIARLARVSRRHVNWAIDEKRRREAR